MSTAATHAGRRRAASYSCESANAAMRQAFIGVDVGTSSARAGIFDETGKLLGLAAHPIATLARGGRYRRAIVLRHLERLRGFGARRHGGGRDARTAAVKGIGFDATCSLVVLASRGAPRHRERIGRSAAQRHRLDGSSRDRRSASRSTTRRMRCCAMSAASISPEMEMPKLLWLKRHLPATYRRRRALLRSRRFSLLSRDRYRRALDVHGDLQVELSSRMRGAGARRYFQRVGLGEFLPRTVRGSEPRSSRPASPLGAGLTEAAARRARPVVRERRSAPR